MIEYSIEKLMSLLDPKQFFQINRKFILSLEAIQKIEPYFNSRLILTLNPSTKEEVIVSRERVGAFKEWLDA